MAKSNNIAATVIGYTQRNGSVNGNPRFILHTTDGDYTTQSDSGCNYSVRNDFDRASESAPVSAVLNTTRAGYVFGWDLV